MGTGYVRQSTASIVTGLTVEAGPLNIEFNQIQSAFDGTSGHSHDGTTGEGPKINLTTSIAGVLPVVHGGIAAIHKIDGTTAPAATDDSGDGYGPGSFWIDTTNDKAYVCVDASSEAAVWQEVAALDGVLQDLDTLGAPSTDGEFIVATGAGAFAYESGATARTSMGAQAQGDVLDDLNTLGPNTGSSEMLVGTAAGTLAWQSGSTLRSTIGVDAAGTDNSTDVTLTGTPDYITISGQEITRNLIDLTADVSGDLPVTEGGTGASDAGTARTNLGLAIGSDVQAYDAELAALAALVSAANKIPMFSGSGSATLLDFKDEDNQVSASATALASQQSIKAYADTKVSSINLQVFTTSGTYTPTSGTVYCIIECVGGGGGGGGAAVIVGSQAGGAGGGGGGYARKLATSVDVGASQTVMVGAGGAGGSPGAGSAGGDTSVGSLCIGKGGAGGAGGTHASLGLGGAGGVAGTGDFTVPGSPGGASLAGNGAINPVCSSGFGGASIFGGGGGQQTTATAADGLDADGYGGGGGGAYGRNILSNNEGGAGADGVVVITEFIA